MIKEEKKEYILNKLTKNNILNIKELSKELNCTDASIRYIVNDLAKKKLLTRVHGGIVKNEETVVDISERILKTKKIKEKEEIADIALKYISDNSTIILSKASIGLVSDYTFSLGNIGVDGESVFAVGDHNLRFDTSATLSVNGVTLWKDSLDNDSTGNITIESGGTLSLLNSGTIRTVVNYEIVERDLTILENQLATIDHGPGNITISSNTDFSYDYFLHYQHKMHITDNATIDGHGCFLHFARGASDSDLIDVADTKLLTLQNTILRDFAPERVDLNSTGRIIFGDGTEIDLTKNILQRIKNRFAA